jgi:hypothetical protein
MLRSIWGFSVDFIRMLRSIWGFSVDFTRMLRSIDKNPTDPPKCCASMILFFLFFCECCAFLYRFHLVLLRCTGEDGSGHSCSPGRRAGKVFSIVLYSNYPSENGFPKVFYGEKPQE